MAYDVFSKMGEKFVIKFLYIGLSGVNAEMKRNIGKRPQNKGRDENPATEPGLEIPLQASIQRGRGYFSVFRIGNSKPEGRTFAFFGFYMDFSA